MFAHRLARVVGEWDIDGLMDRVPFSLFEELMIAYELMDDFDDWQRTPGRRSKDYELPKFAKEKVRRRLDGTPY
jgi:hypothetical protein